MDGPEPWLALAHRSTTDQPGPLGSGRSDAGRTAQARRMVSNAKLGSRRAEHESGALVHTNVRTDPRCTRALVPPCSTRRLLLPPHWLRRQSKPGSPLSRRDEGTTARRRSTTRGLSGLFGLRRHASRAPLHDRDEGPVHRASLRVVVDREDSVTVGLCACSTGRVGVHRPSPRDKLFASDGSSICECRTHVDPLLRHTTATVYCGAYPVGGEHKRPEGCERPERCGPASPRHRPISAAPSPALGRPGSGLSAPLT